MLPSSLFACSIPQSFTAILCTAIFELITIEPVFIPLLIYITSVKRYQHMNSSRYYLLTFLTQITSAGRQLYSVVKLVIAIMTTLVKYSVALVFKLTNKSRLFEITFHFYLLLTKWNSSTLMKKKKKYKYFKGIMI